MKWTCRRGAEPQIPLKIIWYRHGFLRPLALYGMATMYEQLGQPEEARRAWASFVTLTENGDDLPRIAEGREALARLTREPGAGR